MKQTYTTQGKPARMTCLLVLTKIDDKLGHNHKIMTNIKCNLVTNILALAQITSNNLVTTRLTVQQQNIAYA